MPNRVRQIMTYFAGLLLCWPLFPRYKTHRPDSAIRELTGIIPRYFMRHRRRRDSLKVLRRGAFARTQIKEVVIPEGVETLEADVFSRCPLEKIFFLPTGVVDMSLSFSSPFPYMYDATVYLPEGAADSDLYSSWTSHFGTVELLSDEEMGVMLGIGGVAADGQRPGAPYYTLGGVKVGEPLRPGLYISRGKKVLVK